MLTIRAIFISFGEIFVSFGIIFVTFGVIYITFAVFRKEYDISCVFAKKIQSHYGSGLILLNGFGLFVDVFPSTDYHQSLGGGTDTLA